MFEEALKNSNVRAFLRMIRYGEGTRDQDGYRRMFGGKLFDSFADHPRQIQTFPLKGGKTLSSSAAGAYQFLTRTWDGLVKQYGFPDFSPESQDKGCVALIKGRGALEDVIAGRFDQAVRKCNREWASLPESPYGQPTTTLAQARQHYIDEGGVFFEDLNIGEPITKQEKPMFPFVALALPAIIEMVPKLINIFGSGSEVAKRNEKAAELVVEIAKTATGSKNEQELIEVIKQPEMAEAVRTAIESSWYEITLNTEGIAAARVANSSPESIPFYKQPAFYITLMLMPLVYGTVYQVLTSTEFTSEIRAMVVSAIISGVLGGIMGFWMGTSFSSARKTELLKGN
jgi:muramidase (phage lysozyme)